MKEIIKADSLFRLNRQVEEFMENYSAYDWDGIVVITYKAGGEWIAELSPTACVLISDEGHWTMASPKTGTHNIRPDPGEIFPERVAEHWKGFLGNNSVTPDGCKG